jgi:hypothetical protein
MFVILLMTFSPSSAFTTLPKASAAVIAVKIENLSGFMVGLLMASQNFHPDLRSLWPGAFEIDCCPLSAGRSSR